MLQWLKRLINFLLRPFSSKRISEKNPVTDLPSKRPETVIQPRRDGIDLPIQLAETPLKPEIAVQPEYRKTGSLMTFQERKFFRTVLLREFSTDYSIFSKVRLGDLVWLANEPTDQKFHRNQIQCKHIDFVLCNKSTYEPVLAIELDDSSHSNYDRRESDEVKNRICAQAKLPILRVKVEQNYESDAIAQQALNMISGHDALPTARM